MGNGTSITAYDCGACGVRVTRKPTRGQRPKWCEDCRRRGLRYPASCISCGTEFMGATRGAQTCSRTCQAKAFRPPPRPKPKPKRTPDQIAAARRELWSPLRKAIAADDRAGILTAIKGDCTIDDNGCWIWQRKKRKGYPEVTIGGKWLQVHRLALEAHLGSPLGSQHAHHKCARPSCVNPLHLQPVTHRENVAEMLARQSYLARIRELESALMSLDPEHPLLAVAPVA